MILRRAGLVIAVLCEYALALGPQSGDIFRDHTSWRTDNQFGWSLGVDITADDKIPVNHVVDLEGAIRAEAEVQKQSIEGKGSSVQIRINDGVWRDLPGIQALGSSQGEYVTMHYPIVAIPLSDLHNGANTFSVRTSAGHIYIYGVTLRIYYADTKSHPTGSITSVSQGDALGEDVTLACADAQSPSGGIHRVDYIGRYEDVNYRGDGVYYSWHYHYYKPAFIHCLASHYTTRQKDAFAPYAAVWDTRWVPDQEQPIEIAARIMGKDSICYITEPVTGLTLHRPGVSVELCKPYDYPKRWLFRAGHKSNKFDVAGRRDHMVAARMAASTWNGQDNGGYQVNGVPLTSDLIFRGGHNYWFNVNSIEPMSAINRTVGNTIGNIGHTHEHGTEMNYPGIHVLLRYVDPAVHVSEHPALERQSPGAVPDALSGACYGIDGRLLSAGAAVSGSGVYLSAERGTARLRSAIGHRAVGRAR